MFARRFPRALDNGNVIGATFGYYACPMQTTGIGAGDDQVVNVGRLHLAQYHPVSAVHRVSLRHAACVHFRCAFHFGPPPRSQLRGLYIFRSIQLRGGGPRRLIRRERFRSHSFVSDMQTGRSVATNKAASRVIETSLSPGPSPDTAGFLILIQYLISGPIRLIPPFDARFSTPPGRETPRRTAQQKMPSPPCEKLVKVGLARSAWQLA